MSYTWDLPTKVLFGPGKIGELHNETMPGKKALVVISNGKSTITNGSLAKLENELKLSNVDYCIYNKVGANPTVEMVMGGTEMARENKCDFVVALGGGSVMDCAKVIAAMVNHPGHAVWDFILSGTGGRMPLTEKQLPVICITTSAGTGSEVDGAGVITNLETKEKIGFRSNAPCLAIVDPELMLTVPKGFTAYQGFDALYHCIEGYVSTLASEASDMVNETAIRNIAKYLPRAYADGSDLEARTKLAFANTLGGYSMEVSSCTSEHAMEHALSSFHENLPHGAGLIMISYAYYETFIDRRACDEKFVDMARFMGKEGTNDPYDFLRALKELMVSCEVEDLKMSDYGIKPDEFPAMADNALSAGGMRFTVDRTKLSREDVIAIYEKSYK